MNEHLDERQLNDCVDDALDAAERDVVMAHVAACDTCRDATERLRALRADLAALPRSIAPPAHVLMGVRAATAAPPHVARSWHARPGVLAAAAVVLVALSSATTALLMRSPSAARPPAAMPTLTTGSTSLVAVQAMERSYQDEIAQLQGVLRDQESNLAPETLAVLQANLEIIDRALAEARAALQADPGNDALNALVRSGYERKLDVLRSASSHTRVSS
ncbi:MAG TPA: hypothetical protein VK928_02295 [Longimicrobiales bacterium]|nr:hypothetical protein [Longimicrobiales bacterium]